jgi:hypothetical protein
VDIGIDTVQSGAAGRRVKLNRLFQPVYEGKCEFVEGENPEDMGTNLALQLRASKVI